MGIRGQGRQPRLQLRRRQPTPHLGQAGDVHRGAGLLAAGAGLGHQAIGLALLGGWPRGDLEQGQAGQQQPGENQPGGQQQANGGKPQGGEESKDGGRNVPGQQQDPELGPGQRGEGEGQWGELQPYLNFLKNRGTSPKVPPKFRKYYEAYLKRKAGDK
ncbi:MAG: hypothetical protein KC613_10165 [Myxococcales bacterium]|nr:hypothetical protein [Myxococcales bacterium]